MVLFAHVCNNIFDVNERNLCSTMLLQNVFDIKNKVTFPSFAPSSSEAL